MLGVASPRAWATGYSVELHWAERGSRAGIGLLSQRCPQGLQERHLEGGPGLGLVKAPQGGGPRG